MFWTDPLRLSASMWKNAFAAAETLQASGEVIAKRRRVIDAALENPLRADVAELHLMGAEKADAFSRAGASWMKDLAAAQSDCMAQARDLAAMALSGRAPTPAELDRVGRRGLRIATAMSLGFGRALGETMALAMLAGNSNVISVSLLSPADTLAALLANSFPEAGKVEVGALMYAALVLLAITLVVNAVGTWIVQRATAQLEGQR